MENDWQDTPPTSRHAHSEYGPGRRISEFLWTDFKGDLLAELSILGQVNLYPPLRISSYESSKVLVEIKLNPGYKVFNWDNNNYPKDALKINPDTGWTFMPVKCGIFKCTLVPTSTSSILWFEFSPQLDEFFIPKLKHTHQTIRDEIKEFARRISVGICYHFNHTFVHKGYNRNLFVESPLK